MKVMCIKQGKWVVVRGNVSATNTATPKYGEICTVVGEDESGEYYKLAEYPVDCFGGPTTFNKRLFIPLSDINETELVSERQRELASNYSYVRACVMADHYSDLVKTARHAEELEVRLQGFNMWKQMLLNYQN